MPSDLPRPPYEPELAKALAALPWPHTLTIEMVNGIRANPGAIPQPTIEETIGDRPISYTERRVPALEPGNPEITLLMLTTKQETARPRSCVYWIHAGGMVLGDRFTGVARPLTWTTETDAIVISVEYRLAPEHPHPAPVNDCYAGLCWVVEHAQELGIDPERIMIGGASGGGGIAAGVTLMARDRKGPKLCGQYLGYPMLDDRNTTSSSQQYVDEGTWSRGSNLMAWKAVLGDKTGKDGVSIYAAPARAEDLSGLPPAFLDVGSAEVFRDEVVAYASKLWAAGSEADLRVYGGAFHAFDVFAPDSRLAIEATSAQTAWVKNILAPKEGK